MGVVIECLEFRLASTSGIFPGNQRGRRTKFRPDRLVSLFEGCGSNPIRRAASSSGCLPFFPDIARGKLSGKISVNSRGMNCLDRTALTSMRIKIVQVERRSATRDTQATSFQELAVSQDFRSASSLDRQPYDTIAQRHTDAYVHVGVHVCKCLT